MVAAALTNAAQVTGRELTDLRVVMSGAGAAGVAIANMLLAAGVGDVALSDRGGSCPPAATGLTDGRRPTLAARTNRLGLQGTPVRGAARAPTWFIGVSAGPVPVDVVAGMAPQAIVFALANPDPEVHPDVGRAGAAVVATGRSDFPNQINNVLAFPGIFRGALDSGATRITEGMKLAAADGDRRSRRGRARAGPRRPRPVRPRLAATVAHAVGVAAVADGVVRDA